ncbi:MAG: hypothetical protein IKP07_03895 [Bacilli bacterium]|nr:hypothetical protein [Bacilli bacterium]
MEIKGYKGFNKDKTNRYGMQFEEGKSYHTDGPISFGNNGNGFHMATHLSDVFRFFRPEDVVTASVVGSGEVAEGEYDDWSEPYYDMYSVSDLYVVKFLTRDEIINVIKNSSASDIVKFFATYNVTEEEGYEIIRNCTDKGDYEKAVRALLFYIHKVNIYNMGYREQERVVKKVLEYGQNYSQRGKGK